MAKRIVEISKKSFKDAQNEKKAENDLRKMNEGAMKAYASDLANSSDYTSREQNARAAATSAGIGPKVDPFAIKLPEDDIEREAKLTKIQQAKAESLWCEAKTEEDHTYYWNVKTGESVWEKPKEGFMTVKEYKAIQDVVEKRTADEHAKSSKDFVVNADEITAAYNREKLKAYRPLTADIPSDDDDDDDEVQKKKNGSKKDKKYGWENPETAARPIGQWQVVETQRYFIRFFLK